MRGLRATTSGLVLASALAAFAAGCPSRPMPSRDGGTQCQSTEQCNPPGQACGTIFLCVQNACTQDPVVRACVDAAVDGVSVGDCLSYENCNPPGACGSLISCAPTFRCDPDAPRIEVPCDGGGDDAGGVDAGAVGDGAAPGDARLDAAGGG